MSTPVGTVSPAPPSANADGGVRLSPSARRRLREFLADRDGPHQAVWVRPGEDGHTLVLVDRDDVRGREWLRGVEADPLLVWRREAGAALDLALVDHDDTGFRVRLAPVGDEALAAEVGRALEEGVNPLVASHGGRVRLVGVEDGVVRVRMEGGCQGCTSARETLTGVVTRHLEFGVPGIRRVEDVTDHQAGTAPWFGRARAGVVALPVVPDAFLREACG